MSKKTKSPLGIFIESIGLYFSNFDKFISYMTFPVLGQIIGLILISLTTNLYSSCAPTLIEKYPNLNNLSFLIWASVLITLPGLSIYLKAFWEFLVSYGSVNSMVDNMLISGRVYDFEAHTELVKRRTPQFIGIWFLLSCFTIIAILPPFWVIGLIFAIYFILAFQVFTFEEENAPIYCLKRSFNLIKGHFTSTMMLACLVGVLTYILIPQIFDKVFDLLLINKFFAKIAVGLVSTIDLTQVNDVMRTYFNKTIEVNYLSEAFVKMLFAQILIQYTLPLRSILWALWYKELSGNNVSIYDEYSKEKNVKKITSKSKRPSEKLMKNSNKKFSSKKLDRNILKRAMEQEDD